MKQILLEKEEPFPNGEEPFRYDGLCDVEIFVKRNVHMVREHWQKSNERKAQF